MIDEFFDYGVVIVAERFVQLVIIDRDKVRYM